MKTEGGGGGVPKVLWKGFPKEGTEDKDVLTCTHFGSLKDTHCNELFIDNKSKMFLRI